MLSQYGCYVNAAHRLCYLADMDDYFHHVLNRPENALPSFNTHQPTNYVHILNLVGGLLVSYQLSGILCLWIALKCGVGYNMVKVGVNISEAFTTHVEQTWLSCVEFLLA